MRNFDQYADDYLSSDNDFEHFAVQIRRDVVLARINELNASKILEIGCGNDTIFNYIDCEVGHIIEPAELFYEKAIVDIETRPHITIENSTVENSSVRFSDYNFILMSGVLHEIEDPDAVLKLFKSISIDTVLHVNVPNKNSLHRILGVRLNLIKNRDDRSEFNDRYQIQNIFSYRSLIELAKTNGFSEVASGYYGFKPFTHLQMQALSEHPLFGRSVVEELYRTDDLFSELSAELFVELRKE